MAHISVIRSGHAPISHTHTQHDTQAHTIHACIQAGSLHLGTIRYITFDVIEQQRIQQLSVTCQSTQAMTAGANRSPDLLRGDRKKWQRTWVTHVMDAGGKDHGRNLQISQLLCELVIGQKAAQSLRHICCMYVVVIGVVVVCSLDVLH